MATSACRACHNLDYDLFEPLYPPSETDVAPADSDLDAPERYLLVEFEDLRTHAQDGCQTCAIINKGATQFWGRYPESGVFSDEFKLLLRRRLGKSLIATRSSQTLPSWRASLRTMSLQIKFFTIPKGSKLASRSEVTLTVH